MEDTQTAISVDVTDPDLMDDHTITIVADQDPDGWTYEGDGLFAESDSARISVPVSITPPLHFTGEATLTVTVTDNNASDIGDALSAETTFTITVMNFNDAPILNAAAPFFPELTEDDVDNDGTTVELLIGNSITDVDPDFLRGIAVWAAEGDSWQYRTADADTWTALGAVSESAALLLQPDARIRFVPDGEFGENPNPTISYFAWDQTFIPPPENDVQVRGDGTPFSVDSDTATVVVTDVNDPPVAANVTVSDAEEAGLIP